MCYFVDGLDEPLRGLEIVVGTLHHISENIVEGNGEVLTYEGGVARVAVCYSALVSVIVPILQVGGSVVVLLGSG
jgi:hypothetical protein